MLGLTIHAIGHTFQEKLKYIKNLFVSVPLILFLTGYSSYILMFGLQSHFSFSFLGVDL